MKIDIWFFQSRDLMLLTWPKSHVWEPLTLCQHLTWCGVNTTSVGGDMYFICYVTQQDHSVEMSCVFVCESSSFHVTILKSLVTIGIVIVKRKIASSKKSYKYILTLNAYVDWIITRWEKNVPNRKMVNFEKKCSEIKKKYIFPLWLPSITLLLKWKPVELKRS